jgi:hypothetical protein
MEKESFVQRPHLSVCPCVCDLVSAANPIVVFSRHSVQECVTKSFPGSPVFVKYSCHLSALRTGVHQFPHLATVCVELDRDVHVMPVSSCKFRENVPVEAVLHVRA